MEHKWLRKLIGEGSLEYSEELEQNALKFNLPVRRENSRLVLQSPIELLVPEQIKSRCSRELDIEVLWSIDSTNSHLMKKANEPLDGYRICLAEQQVSGRGRRGRSWISPFGSNLYMSVARKFPRSGADLEGLSIVVGIEIAKVLKLSGVDDVGLKWPNDVILQGGKVAGILVEIGPPTEDSFYVVVGIGVNTRLSREDSLQIDQPHSTLEGVVDFSRNNLAGDIIQNVVSGLERFVEHGFAPFASEWDEYNLFRGKQVIVHLGDTIVEGEDAGIDARGNFRLSTENGVKTFNAGEISLRGAT